MDGKLFRGYLRNSVTKSWSLFERWVTYKQSQVFTKTNSTDLHPPHTITVDHRSPVHTTIYRIVCPAGETLFLDGLGFTVNTVPTLWDDIPYLSSHSLPKFEFLLLISLPTYLSIHVLFIYSFVLFYNLYLRSTIYKPISDILN